MASSTPFSGPDSAVQVLESPGLHLAAGIAISLAGISLLLIGVTLLLRLRLIVEERRRMTFLALWRPLMLQALMGEAVVPPVGRRDWQAFLVLWNHLHASLRGDAVDRLNDFGRRAGVQEAAMRFLKGQSIRRRLMAVLALGNLRDEAAWPALEALLALDHPYMSIAAARALSQIDGKRAAPLVVASIARRKDWSASRIASLLNQADPEDFVKPLVESLPGLAPDDAARVLSLLSHWKGAGVVPGVAGVLAGTAPEVLTEALPLAGPRDLARVRELLDHPAELVREQAAQALGRLGMTGDDRRLVVALADPSWRVRYRAAHALLQLPFVEPGKLDALRQRAPVIMAREILEHVRAERGSL